MLKTLRRALPLLTRASRGCLTAGLGVLLPENCPVCGRDLPPPPAGLPAVCAECVAAMHVPERYCDVCSAPVGPFLDTRLGCGHCLKDDFAFERVFALAEYRDRLKTAVLAAKSGGGAPTARWLADRLWDARGAELAELGIDLVAPIPQHWTRRLAAPHNAAELIARRLAGRLKVRCDPLILRKTRRTPAQASLTPARRRVNLRDAFAADPAADGRRLLLVDDVLTTGATAHRAAKALTAAGAEGVWAAVVARGVGQ